MPTRRTVAPHAPPEGHGNFFEALRFGAVESQIERGHLRASGGGKVVVQFLAFKVVEQTQGRGRSLLPCTSSTILNAQNWTFLPPDAP